MHELNVDAIRQALEKPVLVIEGQRYEGKLLSHAEYLQWEAKIRAWGQNATLTDAQATKDIVAFFDALGLPGDQVVQLEAPIVEEAVIRFFHPLHKQPVPQAPATPPAST